MNGEGLWRQIVAANNAIRDTCRRFEDALEDASVIGNASRPYVQLALTTWFGAGTEGVLPGRGSWLFYARDVHYVTGAGFLPGETVQLGVCVLGGMSGYELCWTRNQIRTVAADSDGRFATTITATRYVKTADGPGDCRTDPYGCRVLVRANRSPNAVKLQFADG